MSATRVRYIKSMQAAEGYWRTIEGHRPRSGLARSVEAGHYPGSGVPLAWTGLVECETRIDRRGRGAKALAASQRADGGWNQLATMGSDAYATGEALYGSISRA
jgi:hypothetical protein